MQARCIAVLSSLYSLFGHRQFTFETDQPSQGAKSLVIVSALLKNIVATSFKNVVVLKLPISTLWCAERVFCRHEPACGCEFDILESSTPGRHFCRSVSKLQLVRSARAFVPCPRVASAAKIVCMIGHLANICQACARTT